MRVHRKLSMRQRENLQSRCNSYDAANLDRRSMSKRNRKNTSEEAVPDIDVGDYACTVCQAQEGFQARLYMAWAMRRHQSSHVVGI